MRGVVGDLDGEIIAFGGFYRGPGKSLIVFSDLKPEAKRFRKEILRGARRILEMAAELPLIAVAQVESEPRSPRFLEHLGFVSIGNDGYMLMPKP